jgi:hypothetical protein
MAGEILLAVVLIPGDFVIILRGREHIQIPVPVHISGKDGPCAISPLFATNNGVRIKGDLCQDAG